MNLKSTGHALATGAMFALHETSEAAKNDPALAMRLAATSLSDQLLKKVNTPIQDSFEQSVVPVVRGGILALNAVRATQTFKDPTSTGFDKFMDAGRVVSDLVGFAGGIAVMAAPQYAALGRNLMGFSYAVDAVSHAYRGLTHANKRVAVWQTQLEESKRKQREEEAGQGGGCQQPQPPAQQPQEAKKIEVCIKGDASVVQPMIRGEKISSGFDASMLITKN